MVTSYLQLLGDNYEKLLANFSCAYIFALLSRKKRQGNCAKRRVGQSVKTRPFHGRMRGSIPLRGTKPRFGVVFSFNSPLIIAIYLIEKYYRKASCPK